MSLTELPSSGLLNPFSDQLPPQPQYIPSDIANAQISEIAKFAEMIYSSDKQIQSTGLVGIRKILSIEVNVPIQEVIDIGVVPKILEFMSWSDDPVFQFESTWAITNICSGASSHVSYVVNHGGLDILINLLDSNYKDVIDQSVWAIGNIAGDNSNYRNLCIEKGSMQKFVSVLMRFINDPNIRRNTVWAMSNLVRGKPCPEWHMVVYGVVAWKPILENPEYADCLVDALWGISYVSEPYIQEVINLGYVPYLAHHLNNDSIEILNPALRALGNIVTGNTGQTETVIQCPGLIDRIFELTSNNAKNIRKEACWLLSNVAAGTTDQIKVILDNPAHMEALNKILAHDKKEVATEAAWTLANLACGATEQQIIQLVNQHKYIDSLKTMIINPTPKIKQVALEAITNVLEKSETSEEIINSFVDKGIVDEVEQLADINEFKDKVANILDFFEEVEDDTSENKEKEGENTLEYKPKEEKEESEEEEEDEEEDDEEEEGDEKEDEGAEEAQNFEKED